MPAPPPRPLPSFASMPDEAARRLFVQALSRLSPVQRQAVLLRLRGVADIEEIAARLGLAPDGVRASLAFAIAQLRMALSDTPLDRERNDWLERCRDLLAVLPEPTTSPPPVEPVHDRAVMAARPAAADARTWPRRAVAFALAAVIAVGVFAWQRWAPTSAPAPAAVESGPQRMPPPDAPEAPLTAPDFLLVLLQQQHPGVLEDLDFYVWLAEQDALR